MKSDILGALAEIVELKSHKRFNQLSFHTLRVMSALRFLKSYEVKE